MLLPFFPFPIETYDFWLFALASRSAPINLHMHHARGNTSEYRLANFSTQVHTKKTNNGLCIFLFNVNYQLAITPRKYIELY